MRKEFQIQRLEGMAAGMVHVLGIIIFALLCVTSLIFTRFFPAGYDPEIPYNQIDFFLVTLLGAVILAVLALWLGCFLTRKEEKAERNLRLLLSVVLL